MLGDDQREGEGGRPVHAGWRLSTSPHKYFFGNYVFDKPEGERLRAST
jgi:hypothetical protein